MSNADTISTEPAPGCPLCRSQGSVLYRDLRDFIFGATDIWTLKRCLNLSCQLLWLDPRPSPAEIYKAYRTYYTHADESVGQLGGHSFARRVYRIIREAYWQYHFAYEVGRRSRANSLIGLLAHLHPGGADAVAAEVMFLPAPVARGNRLLEIGCGDGYVLDRMRALSWHVEGIEPDPACIEILRQKGIVCHMGDLRDQSFPSASFDAIFMSHVIEHVYEPVGFVEECFRVLKPGGRLIALTPNANGLGHRIFNQDWRGLEPPRHLQIFNRHNLATVMQRAGFSQIDVRTTNRGAWYLYGMSSAIRSARKAGLPEVPWHARILSPRGLCSQIVGRALVSLRPDKGEEILLGAKKADDAHPNPSLG